VAESSMVGKKYSTWF